MDVVGPLALAHRVETEDDARHLLPLRTLGRGVEEAQVSRNMTLVVWRQACAFGRCVVKGRNCHRTPIAVQQTEPFGFLIAGQLPPGTTYYS